MPLSSRVLASATAVSLLSLCSSCFTCALWGVAWDDGSDEYSSEVATCDDDTEWTWESVGLRLLLTPLALGLDLLTCPVQCAISGDEKKCCHGKR
jgi:hypothetical protein